MRPDPYYACSGTSFFFFFLGPLRVCDHALGVCMLWKFSRFAVPVGPTLEWTFEIALGCGASSESSLSEIPELTFDIDDTFPTTVTLLTWWDSRQSSLLCSTTSAQTSHSTMCALVTPPNWPRGTDRPPILPCPFTATLASANSLLL